AGGEHVAGDIALALECEAGATEEILVFGDTRAGDHVRVEKTATGRENAVGLAKEGKHVAVVVRGLDVGDDVEGARGEGQVLRIADLERGLGKAVLAPAELDRPGREV